MRTAHGYLTLMHYSTTGVLHKYKRVSLTVHKQQARMLYNHAKVNLSLYPGISKITDVSRTIYEHCHILLPTFYNNFESYFSSSIQNHELVLFRDGDTLNQLDVSIIIDITKNIKIPLPCLYIHQPLNCNITKLTWHSSH